GRFARANGPGWLAAWKEDCAPSAGGSSAVGRPRRTGSPFMDGAEILRIIDALHREKDIDKEQLFQSVEFALASAARKKFEAGEELQVHIDRKTGKVEAYLGG